jgi:hypothetical protein
VKARDAMTARLKHVDDAVAADEVQGADDYEIAAAVVEHILERRDPGGVAVRH